VCHVEPGAKGNLRMAGVAAPHVETREVAVAALPAAKGSYAGTDGEESAVHESHIEREGRRQRHSSQQLQVRHINQSVKR